MSTQNRLSSDGRIPNNEKNAIKSFVSKLENSLPINIGKNAKIEEKDILEKLAYSGVLGTFHHDRSIKYDDAIYHLKKLRDSKKEHLLKCLNKPLRSLVEPQKGMLLIDFNNLPYYGQDKKHTKGIKNEKGTSYGHQYLSFQLLGEKQKAYVGFIPINQFTPIHSVISNMMEELTERYDILTVMADREFFNTDDLKTFKKFSPSFLVPATRYESVKEKENQMAVEKKKIVKHSLGVNRAEPVEFNLLRILNEEKDKYYLFATNLNIPEEDVKDFVELYRNRWNIETGFSSKNEFNIRTTSNDHNRRVLFYGVSLLIYNVWQIYKQKKNMRKIDFVLAVLKGLFCSKCPYCKKEKPDDDFYDVLSPP